MDPKPPAADPAVPEPEPRPGPQPDGDAATAPEATDGVSPETVTEPPAEPATEPAAEPATEPALPPEPAATDTSAPAAEGAAVDAAAIDTPAPAAPAAEAAAAVATAATVATAAAAAATAGPAPLGAPALPAGPLRWTAPPQPADGSEAARVISSAWADQALWSEVANQLGNSIRGWRRFAAIAAVVGLACTIWAGTLGLGNEALRSVLATVGVLLLAVVPFLRQHLVSDQRVQDWTRARLASEQLKEAIYRHMMGVLPPQPLDDGSLPEQPPGPENLVRRCRAIKQAVAGLAGVAAATPQPVKERPVRLSIEGYVKSRVTGQLGYYRDNGVAYGAVTQRLRRVELGLGVATVLLGALATGATPETTSLDAIRAAAPQAAASAVQAAASLAEAGAKLVPNRVSWLPWMALLAAAAAAITTYLAASREAELAAKYFATYDLLKSLHDEWSVASDRLAPERIAHFVDAVERTLAAEAGGWVADWSALHKTPASS